MLPLRSIVTLASWSFFSFSLLKVAELLMPNGLVEIALFNVLAIGFIFYIGLKHEKMMSLPAFAVSLVGFNVLILSFDYVYGRLFMLSNVWILHRFQYYLMSSILVVPIAYAWLVYDLKSITRRIK
jgi:hypothetical protein